MNNWKNNKFKHKNNRNKKKFNRHGQNRKIVFESDIKRNFQYILLPAEQKEIKKLREVFLKTNCEPIETENNEKEIKA